MDRSVPEDRCDGLHDFIVGHELLLDLGPTLAAAALVTNYRKFVYVNDFIIYILLKLYFCLFHKNQISFSSDFVTNYYQSN